MGRAPNRRSALSPAARVAAAALGVSLVSGWLAVGVAHAAPSKITVAGTATNKFDPAEFTVTPDAGGKVTIEFDSQGSPHTMQNDDLAGFNSGTVNAGAKKTFSFKAEPGVYTYYCLFHKSLGMEGKVSVTDKDGKVPAAASESAAPSASAAATSTGEPENRILTKLDAEKASNKGKIGGFFALLMASLAALVVAMVALGFATRRRSNTS
jgi:plastocyanin